MNTCTSCGGAIEDGYCTVDGLAAAPAPPGAVPEASSAAPAGSGLTATRQAAGGRGSRLTSGRSVRGRLGAGLVEIPPVPYRDPASAVLADP